MLIAIRKLFIRFAIIIAVIVFTQDFQIFPGASRALFHFDNLSEVPEGVEQFSVETDDGKHINIWYLPGNGQLNTSTNKKTAAIIFHGNGGSLISFFTFQQWFRSQGIPSYLFDYRGYGLSSGWPSEKGIYFDGDAVIHEVEKRENIPAKDLILLGYSLGGAPAARAASLFDVKTLILLSSFSSLETVTKEQKWVRFLVDFLWYRFPTAEYVHNLTHSCLILAHGARDTVIRSSHLGDIAKNYRGRSQVFTFIAPSAGHENILENSKEFLSEKLQKCMATP